ncbi:MAG: aminotransferase class IV [Chitinophagales bacterium]
MYPLIETIQIWNGQAKLMDLHQQRFEQAQRALFPQKKTIPHLVNYLNVPLEYQKGKVKCRVVYGDKVEQITYEQYHKKPIASLQIVHDKDIDYHLKYENRQHLHQLWQQRGDCDDVLIVKNGFVTDSYYCNVVFDDGKQLFTPNTPLLKGIQRQHLLQTNQITAIPITVNDIQRFKQVFLVNALLELGEVVVPIEKISQRYPKIK